MYLIRIWVCALVLAASAWAGQATTVFDGGKPHVYLSIDSPQLGDLSTAMNIGGDALNDLKRCFKLMTGSDLPDSAADGLIPMRLVLVDPAEDAKSPDPLGLQGYQMHVTDKEIVLSGSTALGVSNAIYHALDLWGCRWIMPGPDGEIVPKLSQLTLPVGDHRNTQYMDQRFDGGQDKAGNLWRARNGCGFTGGWITFQHYFHYFFPPEEYFKPHPDFYAWRAGARRPTQLETANPEVIRLMIEKAKARLRSAPGQQSVPVDWDDNIDYSVSPESLALDPPNNPRFYGMPSMTDRAVLVANAVADGIASEFPHALVGFYAYAQHTLPPVAVKPRDNVGVGVTRAMYTSIHYMPDPSSPATLEFWDMLKGWLDICKHVYTYDYDPVPRTEGLPTTLLLQRAESIKKQYGMGVKGNYTDKISLNYAAMFPSYYLEYRIKSDPRRDPKTELKRLCDDFFGPAGTAMNDYYLTLDSATRTQFSGAGTEWSILGITDFITPELLARAEQHLAAARQAVQSDPTFSRRVHMVQLSAEILRNTMTGIWKAKANEYAPSIAAFNRAVQSATELNAMGPGLIPLERFKEVLNEAQGKVLAEHFADRIGYIRGWLLLGPVPNEYRDSQWYDEPFPKALFSGTTQPGRPVPLVGGKTTQWKAYISPKGQVDFTAAFANIQRDWHFSSALAALVVESPNPRRVEFRLSSFDPIEVYLNGKQVYKQQYWDSDAPDKRVIQVELKAGSNLILINSSEYSPPTPNYRWGFYFRITESDGKSISNLRYSLKPADVAKALASYHP